MKNNFWKYFNINWLRKDLYLEHSRGVVLSRSRDDFAPFYINHPDFSFVLTLCSTIIALPFITLCSRYGFGLLMVAGFAWLVIGFILIERIATTNFVVKDLRDRKRKEEIAHRDERLKKQVEKRDAKKHQEENALKQFDFPVIKDSQPTRMAVFLPSSVWEALADFRAKFAVIDARAGFMPEKNLTDLDEVFVAVMDSIIWYDGLSEKLKELDSARTVEIYTALHRAISFLDEFGKKIDEDFTQRMKDNIEVINSIELDSTSQKVTD